MSQTGLRMQIYDQDSLQVINVRTTISLVIQGTYELNTCVQPQGPSSPSKKTYKEKKD